MSAGRDPHAARIAVLGTGALGSLFAARLARADIGPVTMVGTWRAALDAVARDGIRVEEPDGAWTTRVATAHHDAVGAGFDLVLVLGKSAQTPTLAPVAARARAADGLILSLQNGLGHVTTLTAAAEEGAVAAGITTAGATVLAPGVVRWGGADGCILGAPVGVEVVVERLRRAARLLSAAGFDAVVTDDVAAARWTKLAINCAANPLTGLGRVANGALLDSDHRRQATLAVAEETLRIGSAAGVAVDLEIGPRLFAAIASSADNHSSMLQDLERGRPTEIDALCGAVAVVARRLELAAPCNTLLADAVRRAERGDDDHRDLDAWAHAVLAARVTPPRRVSA